MIRFPIDWVRTRFPALAEGEVLMDNAGGAQVPQDVIDRIVDYLATSNVQLGATYKRSARAGAAVAEARQELATLVNAFDPDELIIGSSSTELLSRLARAMQGQLQPGDEVIVSEIDHESNIGPWMRLSEQGVVVKLWRARTGPARLELSDLDALLGPRTRLVAVTQCSNILGSELPISDIAARVHAVGAKLCVDGVGWAAHRLPDVQAMGADFYVMSLYKVFGPHIGMMWGKKESLLPLSNLNHFFFAQDAIPYKLQPGGINYELTAGSAGIVAYLEMLGSQIDPSARQGRARLKVAFDAIAAHEEVLTRRLIAFLQGRKGVTIIGRGEVDATRLPIVSFTVEGVKASAIPPHLDKLGIGIRWGDFYARRLIDALGLGPMDGVVRVSLAHYNTMDEMDRLIGGLEVALDATTT